MPPLPPAALTLAPRVHPSALLAGYAADLALGDPRRWHPVAGFGRLAGALERALWRPHRAAGVLYAGLLVTGTAATIALADGAAGRVRGGDWLLAAAVTYVALGGRSLGLEARAVGRAVAREDLVEARRRLPALVGRDPRGLDGPELCRAAVESLAENTGDAVVAPLLWGALAGPPGAAAHRAANTLDAMVGSRAPRYARFGWAAARLDDALNWPAARLGALLAVALAPAVGGSPRAAWRTLRRDGAAHPSPNGGRLEAAFAGALGLRLGGRNVYEGRVEVRPRLGDGRSAGPDDVERAARLARLVGAGAAAGAAAVRAGIGRRPERQPRDRSRAFGRRRGRGAKLAARTRTAS